MADFVLPQAGFYVVSYACVVGAVPAFQDVNVHGFHWSMFIVVSEGFVPEFALCFGGVAAVFTGVGLERFVVVVVVGVWHCLFVFCLVWRVFTP